MVNHSQFEMLVKHGRHTQLAKTEIVRDQLRVRASCAAVAHGGLAQDCLPSIEAPLDCHARGGGLVGERAVQNHPVLNVDISGAANDRNGT